MKPNSIYQTNRHKITTLKSNRGRNFEIINKKTQRNPSLAKSSIKFQNLPESPIKSTYQQHLKFSNFLAQRPVSSHQCRESPSRPILRIPISKSAIKERSVHKTLNLTKPNIEPPNLLYQNFQSSYKNSGSQGNNRYSNQMQRYCKSFLHLNMSNSYTKPAAQDSPSPVEIEVENDKENFDSKNITPMANSMAKSMVLTSSKQVIPNVVENKVYPTRKPRTRSSLRSASKLRDSSRGSITNKGGIENNTGVYGERRKYKYTSAKKIQPSNMYHLSNVLGPHNMEETAKETVRVEEFDSYLYSTFDYSKSHKKPKKKTNFIQSLEQSRSQNKDIQKHSGMLLCNLIENFTKKIKRRTFIKWSNQAK